MKRIVLLLAIIIGFNFSYDLRGQTFEDAYRAGVKAFNARQYDKAIEKFREALRYNARSEIAWYYAGMAFKNKGQHQQATIAFKKIEGINPDYNPWFYLETGRSFLAMNQFSAAAQYFEKFLDKYPKTSKNTLNRHLGINLLEYSKESPGLRSAPNSMSDPEALTSVNSEYNDYTPRVNPQGDRLYFTSVRKGGFDYLSDSTDLTNWGEDVYVSIFSNDQWSTPQLLPEPINSMSSDFGSAFTGDGQTMVYVRCLGEESVGSCDLYITYLFGTIWTNPVNMGNVVNSEDWESQPTISSDGEKIIFASNRKGGYGGTDLYMTQKNHLGEWGIPQNLGSTVNTPMDESSPYLASDGKTLYFASDGHPGMGGVDVFYTLFENGKWSKPINLGRPLNSPGEDKDFTISAAGTGYFASSRMDGKNYDIYEIELPDYLKPKPSVVVQGVVSDAESSKPLAALVLIEDIETGELITVNKSNETSGEYLVVLPVGRNYSVSATSEGYFFYSQSFELPKDTTYQEITNNIQLEAIKKGTKVVLNNIFFETGRADLKPISYVELNKAVKLLEENPTMMIEIGGHTDDRGSDEANLKLSEARANAVKDYMILAGIDATRLQAKGYGESVPIADNNTADGRKANRRTEFEIIGF